MIGCLVVGGEPLEILVGCSGEGAVHRPVNIQPIYTKAIFYFLGKSAAYGSALSLKIHPITQQNPNPVLLPKTQ